MENMPASIPCLVVDASRAGGGIFAARVNVQPRREAAAIEARLYSIANRFVEPDEVAAALQNPKAVQWPEGVTFVSETGAASLSEFWRAEAKDVQKLVMVYRDNEWNIGLLNPGEPKDDCFAPVADASVRVSSAKAASRPGIEAVLKAVSIRLPLDTLAAAVALARVKYSGSAESQVGVRLLCQWWNAHAPDDLRSAVSFEIEQWDDQKRHFINGDWEVPTMNADGFSEPIPYYAICDDPKLCTPILVAFLRGRPYDQDHPGGDGRVRAVDGSIVWEVGQDPEEMDEAYKAVRGLRSLKFTGLDLRKLPSESECWRLQAAGEI